MTLKALILGIAICTALQPFVAFVTSGFAQDEVSISVATFEVDASPPVGSPLAYDPTTGIQTPLSCRGIVLQPPGEKPVVICSIDWLGVANGAQTFFRETMAKETGTTIERVSLHAVHQHDAPRSDFTAEKILGEHGYGGKSYDIEFCKTVFRNAASAAAKAQKNASIVTHLGLGEGVVEKVASNRRILGEDGKVQVTRYTATRDPKVRAMPVGTIDPKLKMISFWHEDRTIAVLTFYATHPQSYYRTGKASPDFPGLARNARQKKTGIPHIHFNGAGGNIGAGKWNDGAVENRVVLASRVEAGMKEALDKTRKEAVKVNSFSWKAKKVQLPIGRFPDEKQLLATLENPKDIHRNHLYAAKHLAWLRRTHDKTPTQVSCLTLNNSRTLFMPGELFVEYQLEAQELAPKSFVAMAAYGEYGMGYIGTAIAYSQGGYETSPNASRVGPGSETVLMNAVEELLKDGAE